MTETGICVQCGLQTTELFIDGRCQDCVMTDKTQTKEEENWLKKLWDATIFPEMIENRKKRKRMEREMRERAMEIARPEIEIAMAEQMKIDAIAKAKKKAKPIGQKIADSMETFGKAMGVNDKTGEKKDYASMMGMSGSPVSNNKISSMFGGGSQEEEEEVQRTSKKKKKKKKNQPANQPQKSPFDYEDKINEMLK